MRKKILNNPILNNPIFLFAYVPILVVGYIYFLLTGKTPLVSFVAFRKLYCITRGKSNLLLDHVARKVEARRAVLPPKISEGLIFGDVSKAEEFSEALENLRKNGFYKFKKKLDANSVSKLIEFSLNAKALVEGDTLRTKTVVQSIDFQNLLGPRYMIDSNEFCRSKELAEFVLEPNFQELANSYLNTDAVLDLIAMWWLVPYCSRPSSKAAQLFHFDMDRIRFLKFFVYLTDVGEKNGPHTYVIGSHKNKPPSLYQVRRFSDSEIEEVYGTDKIQKILGDAGTIIVADTSGFHKGGIVEHDPRLVLQVEFTSSLFGKNYPMYKLASTKRSHAYRRIEMCS